MTSIFLRRFINFIFGALLFCTNVNAESDSLPLKIDSEDIDITVEDERANDIKQDPFFSFLDEPQKYFSLTVESLARNLDEFFSADNVFYETSGTQLRLREDAIWTESAGIKIKGDVRLKLQLPHTQKKVRFIFQSDEEQNPYLLDSEQDNEYSAEIRGSIGSKDGWKLDPSIGAYLGETIDTYIKFRLNREYNFDKWSIHWDETPYWVASHGWAFDSYLEMNRKINEKDLFRSSTFAGWRKDIDYFELNQIFSMYHRLSDKKAISYFTGFYGISEPKIHTTKYLIGLNYRQNIHKDYLYIELKPEIKYQKINDFRPEYSMIFRLEMLFKK